MERNATPPDGAEVPAPHPQAPPSGTDLPPHYAHCYGCGNEHPAGLHLRVRVGDGLRVHGHFTVTGQHQGAPGLAHGGLLATAFDETLGYLNWLVGKPSVTGRLEVDYLRPVPVGSTLQIDAAVTGVSGRKIYTEAIGRLDGHQAVRARGLFVQVDLSHFAIHGAPDAEELIRRRFDDWNVYNP